jgi:hypothetical protein
VRGHDLLEVVLAEVGPAERLGDLLEVEVDLAEGSSRMVMSFLSAITWATT